MSTMLHLQAGMEDRQVKGFSMLAWLAMFIGANLGMQSRAEQYREIKKTSFLKEDTDKKVAQDLARADDDGFAIAANNLGSENE